MTDRKPGEPITVGPHRIKPSGSAILLGSYLIPVKDAHALCAAIATLAAEAGHPGGVAEAESQTCMDADGCPTEKAVLQRFWRDHRSALVPAPRDAVADALVDKLCAAIGSITGWMDPDFAEDAEALKVADAALAAAREWRSK